MISFNFFKTFLIGALFVSLHSCSAFEKSSYQPPGDGAGSPTPTPTPDIVTDTSEFGLDSCVAEHFEANDINIFEQEQSSNTVADYATANMTLTREQFFDLGNILYYELVSPAGLVDYDKLRNEYSVQWNNLVAATRDITPLSSALHHQHSFWANLYNITMINYIVEEPDVELSTSLVGGTVFNAPISMIGGESGLTLDLIERKVVQFQDSSQTGRDNRFHFMFVCGAVGCPKLRNFLYPEDQTKLETVVNENTFMFFNSTYQIRENGSQVSRLMDWYGEDFVEISENDLPSLADDFIISGCRSDQAAVKSAFGQSLNFWEYDWSINKQ